MTISLPAGWTNFEGGGTNALCGEPQSAPECPDPPCFEIPQMVIKAIDLNSPFEEIAAELDCVNNIWILQVVIVGGVPPFIWTTSEGQIVVTGSRSAVVRIHGAVTSIFSNFTGYPTVAFPNGANCLANVLDNSLQPGVPTDPGYDPLKNYPADLTCLTWASIPWLSASSIRLGKEALDKGIFLQCRHHCSFFRYDCYDRPSCGGDGTVGENLFIIDPFDCPFSEVDQLGNPYETPGKGLGPCYDATKVSFDFPYVWPLCNQSQPMVPPECAKDMPCGSDLGFIGGIGPGTFAEVYEARGGPKQDVRHPNLIKLGCSPCSLIQGTDIIVTATDENNLTAVIEIHVN